MAYRSLREFMATLEAQGELVRVSEPVSTVLEMTEIQTRLLRNGGPAVLFEKPVMPDGSISPIPCLANLFGTVKRVAMGVTLAMFVVAIATTALLVSALATLVSLLSGGRLGVNTVLLAAQRLGDPPLQGVAKHRAYLVLPVGRELVDHAVDRGRRRIGV